MEKSINDIWTKGFENPNELSIPKVMNLYNQKSKLLLEKIKKTYQTDNKSLIPIAILFAVGLSLAGHILIGFYGMILMIGLFFFNIKLLNNLENIQITSSNYDYLIAYKKNMSHVINATTKLLGIGLPFAVIPSFWLFYRNTEVYFNLINKTSSLNLVVIVLILIGSISLIGTIIYKISNKILYGNLLNDLENIISDLKYLK